MGEYFDWVNVNKREYISPGDFDYDNRFHGSLCKNNSFLRALYELLSGRWKGDPVVFLGDEAKIPEDTTYGLLHDLLGQAGTGHYYDFICENHRNVSCLFRDAEKDVRESIGDFIEDIKDAGSFKYANEYGIDIRRPFAGLFSLKGRIFPYIINHTKGVYYSLSETPILYQDGVVCDYADPLPILLGYGRSAESGLWLGDVVGVSDEISSAYTPVKEIYLDW